METEKDGGTFDELYQLKHKKSQTYLSNGYYCFLKVIIINKILLFYVFFDVESESEVRFGRSPLFFELWK